MSNLEKLDASLIEAFADSEKLPEKHEWLKEKRSEAARAQYAFLILKRHFAAAKLPLKHAGELPASWWGFGWAFYLNVDEHLKLDAHLHPMSDLFEEVCYFCEIAFSDNFVYRLKELLENVIQSNSSHTLNIYLPQYALDHLDEIKEIIDEEWDDYMRRLDVMYY